MKQCLLKITLLIVVLQNTFCVNRVTGITQYIGFGDSTLDSGYFRYNTTGNPALDALIAAAVANGDSGAFVANGVMNSIILANKLCVSAVPVGASGRGTNYANGGSYTATNNQPYAQSVSAIQQIKNYLTVVNGAADLHALYVIKSGDNDLNYSSPLPPNYLSNSASALAQEVAVLQAAGARTIMVPNSYNSAVFAGPGGDIDPSNAAKYADSVAYFSLRWSDLHAAGVCFIPADIDSMFKYVVHNPTIFGFTSFSVLANNGPAVQNPSPYNSALLAYPLTPSQLQTFLFVDNKHLTTAGQTIEADYEYSLLAAPNQISLVTESALQNGLAIAGTIQRQLDFSRQMCATNRTHFWATGGANYLCIKNAHDFPCAWGVPFGGTIGVDYRMQCGATLGVAFTAGSQKQRFSNVGGHFKQIVQAPSLYAAYHAGRVWGDALIAYSAFQNKINRCVLLGMFTDENHAHSAGYSLALMLGVGGDFTPRHITTGPVAYIVLQRVHMSGFRETGTSSVTALSFASQTRHSLVSQLGWRIVDDIGRWQPFAQARWNHTWWGKNNRVTVSLTSVEAPSYSMATVPVVSNWADAWLGTAYQINSRVALRGTFVATFCNRRVTAYGGELGLNVSF